MFPHRFGQSHSERGRGEDAIILSVMICERRRRPFDGLGSRTGRSDSAILNVRRDRTDEGRRSTLRQARRLVRSLPVVVVLGRSGTTTSTISPRFTSRRSSRKPPHSTHRWHRSPDAAPSALSHGEFPRAPSGSRKSGTQMLHRPQPLRAQPLAARRHALLRGARALPFSESRGHRDSVTCYAGKFDGWIAPASMSLASTPPITRAATMASCR